MAEVAKSVALINTIGDVSHVVSWASIPNGDTGEPIEMPGSNDRSIQFSGTFGVGGSINLEGSNDGTNWVVLTDPQGNAITKTAAAIEMVTELTRYVRPRVTAGDANTAITASLFLKASKQ